ncbi:SLC13 family permease [Robiginitomaculum antarcticum]|uniref:SLC13 family permease n=1 Tax=Robiginitomaculum antarcticum TaxID=437507 RepID=UPI00037F34B2|nr:SLC13 family permease [Robiginitomaculum antarcticum]
MDDVTLTASWQMWATFALVLIAVWLYFTERFSIEATSVLILTSLLVFFGFFGTGSEATLSASDIFSGFSDPALITIMALLVIGQGMFQTGALERPTKRINSLLKTAPRRTFFFVFGFAFLVSMFMNNTPIVVMFIPVISAMALQLRGSASRLMMPLSFICILAGMTTLIGSSTNLLVASTLERLTPQTVGFFDPTGPGLILAAVGGIYIVIFAPILLPKRTGEDGRPMSEGHQYIAQIKISDDHPLIGVTPKAGLYPGLRNVIVRVITRAETKLLPPFEDALTPGDVLTVAATRQALRDLMASRPEYLRGMLNIGEFENIDPDLPNRGSIVISEAVVAPGSRLIDRSIKLAGFRQNTGCLVLGIRRRSRMLRENMLDIRLEAGDTLLLFGYESDTANLRENRDVLLLDWATKELPDIRKSRVARVTFLGVIALAAAPGVPIVMAALGGALAMMATKCLNIRQAVRALDMKIFLLIGAAFAMGIALERTGGALFIANYVVDIFMPFGPVALLGALFFIIAATTNILSNSATALLFAPIAVNISAQSGIDPLTLVLTVIFAANCCFATPIAYQTNLLVMGPGHYRFSDFVKFGLPLVILLWVSFMIMTPFVFDLPA